VPGIAIGEPAACTSHAASSLSDSWCSVSFATAAPHGGQGRARRST